MALSPGFCPVKHFKIIKINPFRMLAVEIIKTEKSFDNIKTYCPTELKEYLLYTNDLKMSCKNR